MFLLVVIIIIVVAIAKAQNKAGESAARQENYQNDVAYGQRMNLYQNAINQNRYHYISKLSRDYHIPIHTVMSDLMKMQEDGFLTNIKVSYNSDEIQYLDEEEWTEERTEDKRQVDYQQKTQAQQAFEQARNYNGQSVAYAKTRTRSQKYEEKKEEVPSIQVPKPKKAVNMKKEKINPIVTDGVEIEGMQEEYKPDYEGIKVEYNYVAEYPDTSHIWDDLNTSLFTDNDNMVRCPQCGTENIIVRDSAGKCDCYFCQAELS